MQRTTNYTSQFTLGIERRVDDLPFLSARQNPAESRLELERLLFRGRTEDRPPILQLRRYPEEREPNNRPHFTYMERNNIMQLLNRPDAKEIINIVNQGETPLHVATKDLAILERLLACEANIDAQDRNENTPLHIAVSKGQLNSVKKLVAASANFTITNNEEKTPLDIAKEKKDEHPIFQDISDYLIQCEKRQKEVGSTIMEAKPFSLDIPEEIAKLLAQFDSH